MSRQEKQKTPFWHPTHVQKKAEWEHTLFDGLNVVWVPLGISENTSQSILTGTPFLEC